MKKTIYVIIIAGLLTVIGFLAFGCGGAEEKQVCKTDSTAVATIDTTPVVTTATVTVDTTKK